MVNLKNKIIIIIFIISNSFLYGEADKNILFISSYHPSFPTFFEQVNGIKDIFVNEDIVLDIEFMDSKRFFDPKSQELFLETLKNKLNKLPDYNGIIISDDNALIFMEKYQNLLFPGIPIVFCGINNIEFALSMNNNDFITGFIEDTSVKETVEIIMDIHSDYKELYLITDPTTSGQSDLLKVETIVFKNFNIGLNIIDLSVLTYKEFSEALSEIEINQPVLLLSAFKDKIGDTKTFDQSLTYILDNLKSPIYHLWFHGLGDGIVGGKLISHYEQGRSAASLMVQIINNVQDIKDIKVTQISPNQLYFDYAVMGKYGISIKDIPKESLILNRPWSFYSEYTSIVWFVILAIVLLIIVIVVLYRDGEIKNELSKEHAAISIYIDSILNSINSGIVSVDNDYNIVRENRKIYSLLKPERILTKSKNVFDVYPFLIKHISPTKSLISTGQHKGEYSEYIPSTGKYLEISSFPIDSSLAGGFIIKFEDITNRVLFERKLINSEKEKAVGGVASGMAHEINNPLAGIIQNIAVLESRLVNADKIINNEIAANKHSVDLNNLHLYLEERNIYNIISTIKESGERISLIITNMLNFSKRKNVVHVKNSLHSIIDSSLVLAASDFNINKSYDFKAVDIVKNYLDKDITLLCNMSEIQQVLLHILHNSASVMLESKIENPLIRISTGVNNKVAIITIEDNGPGMDKETISKIFKPFYTSNLKEIGAGLSLSISQFIIVTNHNGELLVKSELGKGSKIIIKLPLNIGE